jgi:hypothetical protein
MSSSRARELPALDTALVSESTEESRMTVRRKLWLRSEITLVRAILDAWP